MRVLWFTNTPSLYTEKTGYNGGGWISSLQRELGARSDVKLGVCFFMNGGGEDRNRRDSLLSCFSSCENIFVPNCTVFAQFGESLPFL